MSHQHQLGGEADGDSLHHSQQLAARRPLTLDEALEWIEAMTSDAHSVQLNVLREILALNSDTEYLRNCNFKLISPHDDDDLQSLSFKRSVPVITYKDIEPLIKRIAHGDKAPILTSTPISEFLSRNIQELGLNHDTEGLSLFLLFVKPEFTTPGGLPVRTGATRACKNPGFRANAKAKLTSPAEVLLCEDASQTIYCHLLCGLIQRSKVESIRVIFASGFLRVMRFFQDRWRELVEDIRTGTLSKRAVSDMAARTAMEELLARSGGPNATLAQLVEEECENLPSWQGIIRRLWPNAKYVATVLSGAMAIYTSKVEFYTGGLPLVSPFYVSSECYMGVNITPLCKPSEISYMLIPNMAYFEFIPISRTNHTSDGKNANFEAGSEATLVDLVDVKVGKEYEIVVTTYAGLYRYRMGDVVKVIGFHNTAPLVKFVGRRNVLLSIDVDKTEEETLQAAVRAATLAELEKAGWWLVDYTSLADTSTVPGHYVLFWELIWHVCDAGTVIGPPPSTRPYPNVTILEECCHIIEEHLDSVYRRGRVLDKSIGPLEIRVVRAGTFDALMEFLCTQQQGSSYSQYKTPRCMNAERHASTLDLLNGSVLCSVSNPKCPSWELPTHP